jgi:small multidrug resistance family-3 protein
VLSVLDLHHQIALFVVTALPELGGCYLTYVWQRHGGSYVLLLAAAAFLRGFAWLLALHPNAGRAYAAHGGVYVACAVLWGWWFDGQAPDRWDIIRATISLAGMLLIAFGPRG